MDGVVVDSDRLWNHVIGTVTEKYSLDLSVLGTCDGFNLSTGEAICKVLESSGRYDSGLFGKILEDIDDLYVSEAAHLITVTDGIPDLLRQLKDRGVVLGLVSNSSGRQVCAAMEVSGLGSLFDFTVTSDDVQHGKPDAEPYVRALSMSGLSCDEAVAVEDSLTGVASARNAGICCLQVSCGNSCGEDCIPLMALGKELLMSAGIR